ncbi:MAG TPA: Ppx/GppA phosphatase family protein [Polyangiaceae bacterium]|nr:Ppx/GppA phosphatase family protein [Polyangiaceae bacterium]
MAAIDIGTNTVRLLIQSQAGHPLARELAITRLGEGVDKTGVLDEAAMGRTLSALETFAQVMTVHQPGRIRVVATSAARDARNRDDFFARVATAVGSAPELLDGQAEATLSFRGATLDLTRTTRPRVVVDIGGGSTEFAMGRADVEMALSLNIGSVRLCERHLHSDPPSAAELNAARADLHSTLQQAQAFLPYGASAQWLGVAGSVTTIAALAAGLKHYDPTVTHAMTLTQAAVDHAVKTLSALTVAARRPLLIEPKRAEAIVGGALVLQGIFDFFKLKQMRVSETDILDGLARSLL